MGQRGGLTILGHWTHTKYGTRRDTIYFFGGRVYCVFQLTPNFTSINTFGRGGVATLQYFGQYTGYNFYVFFIFTRNAIWVGITRVFVISMGQARKHFCNMIYGLLFEVGRFTIQWGVVGVVVSIVGRKRRFTIIRYVNSFLFVGRLTFIGTRAFKPGVNRRCSFTLFNSNRTKVGMGDKNVALNTFSYFSNKERNGKFGVTPNFTTILASTGNGLCMTPVHSTKDLIHNNCRYTIYIGRTQCSRDHTTIYHHTFFNWFLVGGLQTITTRGRTFVTRFFVSWAGLLFYVEVVLACFFSSVGNWGWLLIYCYGVSTFLMG